LPPDQRVPSEPDDGPEQVGGFQPTVGPVVAEGGLQLPKQVEPEVIPGAFLVGGLNRPGNGQITPAVENGSTEDAEAVGPAGRVEGEDPTLIGWVGGGPSAEGCEAEGEVERGARGADWSESGLVEFAESLAEGGEA
jgi:hypothetical protein